MLGLIEPMLLIGATGFIYDIVIKNDTKSRKNSEARTNIPHFEVLPPTFIPIERYPAQNRPAKLTPIWRQAETNAMASIKTRIWIYLKI